MNDTKEFLICQDGIIYETIEVLADRSASGRERPWRKKKLAVQQLSEIYKAVNPSKSDRLNQCANFLQFLKVAENLKLAKMDSCRVRLCPICSWRRELKIFHNVNEIVSKLGDKSFLFLTLTVKNCNGEDLDATIDLMMQAWGKFVKRKTFKSAVQGWYRGLEITHNINKKSASFNTYHPHFHVILVVNKSYFTNKSYIKQDEWRSMWQSCLKVDYAPLVNIKKCYGNSPKMIAEAAKYTVKDSDYIVPSDWKLSVDTVRVLDSALDGRRLVAFGGVMKQLHEQLHLDDEVDGNLIHVDGDAAAADLDDEKNMVSFFWNAGYSQYIKG